VLLAIAAIAPALLAPGFSFYFDITPKVVLLIAGTALALVAWDGTIPTLTGAARWIAVLLAAQLLWLGLDPIFSAHPALSVNGGNWRRFGFVTWTALLLYSGLVVIDCAGRPERVIRYLRALVVTGIPIALYGSVQYLGLDVWLPSNSYLAGEGPFTIVRPPATLGHAGYFGTYLVFVALAGAALTACDTGRLWKWAGVGALALSGFAMALSGTRAAIVGLLVGLLVLIARVPGLRTRRLAAYAAILAISMAALFFSPAGARMRSRVHWSVEEPLGGARPLLWRDSLAMAARSPLTGYGLETFGTEFPRHESAALARAFPDFQHESPHNIFLDALTSTGVPGLLLLAATLGLCIWQALFAGTNRTLAAALGAALIGAIIAQQFNVFTVPTALVTYLICALIVALTSERGAVALPARPWLRIASIAVSLALAVYTVRLSVADRQLALMRDALYHSDLKSALAHYEVAAKWHPPGSSADLYASRELANLFRRLSNVRVKLQTWTPAFQAATRAVRTSEERQNAYYNVAIFFATQNDALNVERSLRNAIFWAPNWFKPHWTLSRLLLAQGRTKEAEAEARRAVDLDGGKDHEVTETLQQVRAAYRKE
jgi:O-antigen ligase